MKSTGLPILILEGLVGLTAKADVGNNNRKGFDISAG
jgi:hypothetical protein